MRTIRRDADEHTRQQALERAAELLETADKQDAMTIVDVITCVCEVLRSDNGAMVVMVDMEGDGRMDMLALGNQFVIPGLLQAAPMVGNKIYAETPEVLQ